MLTGLGYFCVKAASMTDESTPATPPSPPVEPVMALALRLADEIVADVGKAAAANPAIARTLRNLMDDEGDSSPERIMRRLLMTQLSFVLHEERNVPIPAATLYYHWLKSLKPDAMPVNALEEMRYDLHNARVFREELPQMAMAVPVNALLRNADGALAKSVTEKMMLLSALCGDSALSPNSANAPSHAAALTAEAARVLEANEMPIPSIRMLARRYGSDEIADRFKARTGNLDAAMAELGQLIGLDSVKAEIEGLKSLVRYRQICQDMAIKGKKEASLHLVFTGNPGTGKTTVARLLGKIYKELGVLKKGHVVEVDRGGLIAGYVGQTAIKTKKKIKEAMDGILFIDEAYALANQGGNDFGGEAVEAILKAMEDHRGRLVVVVAGYPDLMKNFINSNPGLQSRFNKYINFPDYNKNELGQIFEVIAAASGYKVEPDALAEITKSLEILKTETGKGFGNGRTVRNLFEKIELKLAFRVEASGVLDQPADGLTEEQLAARNKALSTITLADAAGVKIESKVVVEDDDQPYGRHKIGFTANIGGKKPN